MTDPTPLGEPRHDGLAPHGLGRFGDYGGRYVPEALVAATWPASAPLTHSP